MRLAAALDTTPGALFGADLVAPPGQHGAAQHPALEALTIEQCRAHLAPGGIGRFLFVADRGPIAVPVNYAMLGADVVFRTDDRTAVAGAVSQRRVSFEVDQLDDVLSEGWGVLVTLAAAAATTVETEVTFALEEVERADAARLRPTGGIRLTSQSGSM